MHTRALFLLYLTEVTGSPVPCRVQREVRNRDLLSSAHWFADSPVSSSSTGFSFSSQVCWFAPTSGPLFFTKKFLNFRPGLILFSPFDCIPTSHLQVLLTHPWSTPNSSCPLSPQSPHILLNLSPGFLLPHSHSSISPAQFICAYRNIHPVTLTCRQAQGQADSTPFKRRGQAPLLLGTFS